MAYKIRDSRKIIFLSSDKFDLAPVKNKLKGYKDVESLLRREILGNLREVVGPQEIQWLSRNKVELWPEYIIHRYKFKIYPRIMKLEGFPLHLLIEPTSICNLACAMCFQSDASFRTKEYMGMMDLDFFKELIDQAVENKCKALTLASRGEPTLHKKFADMLSYCRGKFLELKINTNAVNLNDQLCHAILEAGVDIIVFSVDSCDSKEYARIRGSLDFKKVVNNIKLFTSIRGSKKKYFKTSTRIQGVRFSRKQSSKKFFTFWKGFTDTITFNKSFPRWDTYHNETTGFNKRCSALWERMYVWYDGTCNPCDFDYKSKLAVGNAKDKPLKAIWLGSRYAQYRRLFQQGKRSHLYPCDRCSMF